MKQYVYTSAHSTTLNKYRTIKILFLVLGCLVLLLQSICWLIVWGKNMPVSTSDMVFVTITLVASFLFILAQLFFAVRNNQIIRAVRENGECQNVRLGAKFFRQRTFAHGLVILSRIISIVFVLLLGILIVNFIQDYLNWGKVILKLPLMVLLVVEVLNMTAEIRYQTMLEEVDRG